MKIQIYPSLLAADFGHLAEGALAAENAGADALHLDIMDGHFVPNISFGPAVVSMSRKVTGMPLHVHLMLSRPDRYLDSFIEAGADTLLIHIEAECDVPAALDRIKELGVVPGITVNPETEVEAVFPVLDKVDEVLVMSVHPGYGGQKFIPEVLPKLAALRREQAKIGKQELVVSIDGGVGRENIEQCAENGCNAFVAGTSLYKSEDMPSEVNLFRDMAGKAYRLPG